MNVSPAAGRLAAALAFFAVASLLFGLDYHRRQAQHARVIDLSSLQLPPSSGRLEDRIREWVQEAAEGAARELRAGISAMPQPLDASSLAERIERASAAVAALEERVAAAQERGAAVASRLAAAEGGVAAAQSHLDGLPSAAELRAQLSAREESFGEFEERLASLKAEVEREAAQAQHCAAAPAAPSAEAVEALVGEFLEDGPGAPDLSTGVIRGPGLTSAAHTPSGRWVGTELLHFLRVDGGVGGPEAAITPGRRRGECFAFSGAEGSITVELLPRSVVAAVTVEHADAAESPDRRSAPRRFRVLCDGEAAGDFEYDLDARPVQTFQLPRPKAAGRVTFRVLSNHGHPEYTCLYRVRVHG